MALPIQRSDCVCTVELLDGKGSTQGSPRGVTALLSPCHGLV